MSYYDRNTKYLEQHRIIYRQNPTTDQPTETFEWGWWYENGTHQCYTLFNSRAKINTYKSLKWHLLVLWYLNPKLGPDDFNSLAEFIVDKSNGFTTFSISSTGLERIIHDVYMSDLDRPPTNRLRRVVFKMSSGLDKSDM